MSVLDNALRQIWTHGLKIVEIWKNASPTSSFGAQDIQLDLTRYDLCAVEHSTAIGGDTRFLITDTARLSELGEGYNGALIFGAFCNEGSTTSSSSYWGGYCLRLKRYLQHLLERRCWHEYIG